ncbi:MAG: HesB/IscA family protein [Pseudobdellovibrionaceae bacterium]
MFGLTEKEFTVTDEARVYLREKMSETYAGFRLSILTGKGCGGNEYDLRPVQKDEQTQEDDVLNLGEGLKLFIPKTDSLRLFGSTLDFITDHLGSRRIEIRNPNESSRCGCGESVSF